MTTNTERPSRETEEAFARFWAELDELAEESSRNHIRQMQEIRYDRRNLLREA